MKKKPDTVSMQIWMRMQGRIKGFEVADLIDSRIELTRLL